MKNSRSANNTERTLYTLIAGIAGSVVRTTVRFVKNIPNKITGYIKRRINDYKRRPERKEMNKVYVLVGYTTKAHIEERYNRERQLMILRKGLLILIFVLIVFISINSIIPYVNVEQYRQMFGVGSVEDITEEDPFKNVSVGSAETTLAEDVESLG